MKSKKKWRRWSSKVHRHGYKGRKFGRERDQRRALLKGLSDSLVKYESIETTLTKAKEVVSYTEKLITKAKVGDLHNRRLIIADLQTKESAHKLVDEIAPKLTARNSGYFRVVKTKTRVGDNAQLARISFVDDLSKSTPASVKETKSSNLKTPLKTLTPKKSNTKIASSQKKEKK